MLQSTAIQLLQFCWETVSLARCLQGGDAVAQLLDLRAINRLMDFLQEGVCTHYDLLAMLLANLTAPQAGTDALLQVKDGATAGLYLCATETVELRRGRCTGLKEAAAQRACKRVLSSQCALGVPLCSQPRGFPGVA